MARRNAKRLLQMCECGRLNAYRVLKNVLMNCLSADEADEIARTEYDIDDYDEEDYDDEDYDEDDEDYDDENF